MTPARKAALQWFYDRGEVPSPHPRLWLVGGEGVPSHDMVLRMKKEGQVEATCNPPDMRLFLRLTDKGRRMLHGDRT